MTSQGVSRGRCEVPFDQGREQMKRLPDMTVIIQAVERTAEVIGKDIAARRDETWNRALQVPGPLAVGQPIPVLYVPMEDTPVMRPVEGREAGYCEL
jgi:hypothetical protein